MRSPEDEAMGADTNALGLTAGLAPQPVAEPPGRRPGRPTGSRLGLLSEEMIISTSLQLTREVPLYELSIVRIAQELKVAPGLIHYYIGGRDAITSGVMNAFYRELIHSWPPLEGQWRPDLEMICKLVYNAHASYPGIAAYVVSHNKFRMVQAVPEGMTDYGILLFEKFTAAVRAAGFDALRTGMYSHLLNEFITGYAQATATHRWPGEHAGFLNARLAVLDKRKYPAAHFVRKTFTQLDATVAFEAGLDLFLNGLEFERKKHLAPVARRPTGANK